MSWFPWDTLSPLLIVALGALWSERAGVLNIALEGQMLAGALAAVLGFQLTGNLVLALSLALMVGTLTGLLLAWGTLDLGADPFIAALGLNLLLPALSGWVSFAMYGNLGVIRLDSTAMGSVAGIPLFGLAALVMAGASQALLFFTPWGLRLRAAGGSSALMLSRGLRTKPYQRQGLMISGALGALGGAVLALSLGAFVPGMSAGKGWIALVALYLGLRSPVLIILACLLLAWSEQGANLLQSVRELPTGLIMGLPSLVTVAVYVATSASGRRSRLVHRSKS